MDDYNYIKNEIKRRVSLPEIVGETVRLKRSGKGFIGCCPFHKDKKPSFSVYRNKDNEWAFKCFSCDAKGDVINFIEKRDGISFIDALKVLAPRAGLYISDGKEDKQPKTKRRKPSTPRRNAAPLDAHPSQEGAADEQRAQVPDVIPPEYVEKSVSAKSVLISFLSTLFNEQSIKEMIKRYRIGATRNGGTIFWQIDREHRVRTGKIIYYNKDGHRIKKIQNDHPDWIHYKMKQRGLLPQAWNLSQCLFGEHLLTEYPSAPVALVEAEKTAAIASMAFSNYGFIWLATGGMNNGFNAQRLSVLANRKVIVFPDAGNGFNKWESQIRDIAQTIKFKSLSFSYLMRNKVTADEEQKGIDIADWIIKDIQASKQRPQALDPAPDARSAHAAPVPSFPGTPPMDGTFTPGASSPNSERPLMPSPVELARRAALVPGQLMPPAADEHPRAYEIPKSKVLQSMIDKNPAIGELCTKFGLELISETPSQDAFDNVLDPSLEIPDKCPF